MKYSSINEHNNQVKKMVSVLIVAYNAKQYILETLESCLSQTYHKFEILILDNNSKDDTIKKIQQFSDSRIRLFKSKKNLGPYGGLNFLLTKANGNYIAIQDHDDVWFPQKIQKQVNFLNNNSNFVACGTNTFYYYEKSSIVILNQNSRVTNFVDHTSLMFRRKKIRYDTQYVLADEYFEKKILKAFGEIGCLQQGLTIHRLKEDGSNLSSSRFKVSKKNLRDFFMINGWSMKAFMYLIYLIIDKYIPAKILWIIRRKITLKNRVWFSVGDFLDQHRDIKM